VKTICQKPQRLFYTIFPDLSFVYQYKNSCYYIWDPCKDNSWHFWDCGDCSDISAITPI